MQQLFGVDPFPNHVNLSMFKRCEEFDPVGIGPLWREDTPFVTLGVPDKRLSGDLRSVAERMKVQCPPTPMGTKEELRIFRDFVFSKPRPKTADWVALAKIFKENTDCKTVFPKLPSLLKNYFKKFERNVRIKKMQKSIGADYDSLLKSLAKPVDTTTAGAGVRHQMDTPAELDHEHGVAQVSLKEGLAAPISVTNLAAPQQETFTQTTTQRRFRHCARMGCMRNAYECGGITSAQCTSIILAAPQSEATITSLEKEKEELKKRQKNRRETERKVRKKEEREKARKAK
jgi:hypothetical protein